jgi:cyclic pyranopterin phosphate synthase
MNYAMKIFLNLQHSPDKIMFRQKGSELSCSIITSQEMSENLSHIGEQGNIRMVDVGSKPATMRVAVAEGIVVLPDNIISHFASNELHMAKGPVFQTAIVAAIMAAKKTGDLIPLCHPLGLDHVQVNIRLSGNEAHITAEASVFGKTGVEMEAMTAVSIAALTIYDMCKAMSHDIEIRKIRLVKKSGGKNEFSR